LTSKRIRRGSFASVAKLKQAIAEFLAARSDNPKPFVWTANRAIHCRKTLPLSPNPRTDSARLHAAATQKGEEMTFLSRARNSATRPDLLQSASATGEFFNDGGDRSFLSASSPLQEGSSSTYRGPIRVRKSEATSIDPATNGGISSGRRGSQVKSRALHGLIGLLHQLHPRAMMGRC
jgi:hypothetical protein